MARRAKSRAKARSKARSRASYTRVKAAKDAARLVVGAPPPTRVVPDPKKKRLAAPRHRDTLERLQDHARADHHPGDLR